MSEKNLGGRPSKFDPKYIKELEEYFDIKPYLETTKTVASQGREVLVDVTEVTDFPSISGFATKIGVHRCTLYNWAKENKEFKRLMELAKEIQENWILVNGMKGLVPANFGIFTLKNVCGYRDHKPGELDRTVTHEGGEKPIQTKVVGLEERLEQLSESDD